MDLFTFQVITIFALFGVGTIGGAIPYWLLKTNVDPDTVLSYGNAFSGGVLLGACFLHILPDTADSFSSDYPVSFLCVCIGILLMLFLETVIGMGHSHSTEHKPLLPEKEEVDSHNHKSGEGEVSVFTAVILYIMLSIHSLISGFSLGMAQNLSDAYTLFFAIAAHKWAAVMAASVSGIRAEVDKKTNWVMICCLSASSPLGVALGLLIAALLSSDAALLVSAVAECLAAGTFCYVAIVEIIAVESKKAENKSNGFRATIFWLVVAGWTLMAIVAIWG
eukprot:gnl/Dysnectes_brevis/2625_a3171_1656.p1 GENE.gnl/Dysnectes_brevis/2625_a3171_1656~~gnl/Dysnectes_brevis/2625_a3171_1656.p1  ORF type:complete len:278 (+),score=35.28 gnl/Dysnectes_brevis/2625_a3171_1656:28-861(+)